MLAKTLINIRSLGLGDVGLRDADQVEVAPVEGALEEVALGLLAPDAGAPIEHVDGSCGNVCRDARPLSTRRVCATPQTGRQQARRALRQR